MKAIIKRLRDGETVIEIPEGAVTKADLLKFANALRGNTTLEELRLGGLGVDDDVIEALANALANTTSKLKLISLGMNNVTARGAKSIANALVVNVSLEALNLANNQIADEGLIAICEALYTNNKLNLIAAFGNGITDVGAIALSNVVKVNRGLKRLHFGGNSITDVGCAELANALQVNNVVEKVGLVRNVAITDVGAQSFLRALERNTSLNELWVDGNQVSDHMIERLALLTRTIDLRQDWARAVVLCSGGNKRCGKDSALKDVPFEIIRKVLTFTYSTKEEMEKHHEEDDDDEEAAAVVEDVQQGEEVSEEGDLMAEGQQIVQQEGERK